MKQKFVLIISLAAGLLAAVLAYIWLNSKKAEFDREYAKLMGRGKASVVASDAALPVGTVIENSDIGIMKIDLAAVTDDHILEKDAMRVIGRKLIYSTGSRTPLLWTYLDGGKQRFRTLSDDIQQGMRAVSIPVSGASGVSGMLRPNDSVDVLGSFVLNSAPGTPLIEAEMVTLTVLQNVTVLAVGDRTVRSQVDSRSASNYGTVTLHVTPREAEVLVFAQQMRGKLFLTLRNSTDVYFEEELPRVDFNKIETELQDLNEVRQTRIRNTKRSSVR
ncbi:MAG: Flp pilus assembly protein CpaB [Lentisphaerae bacterium]|nr:Flp pilus assembly protein CpaB [Lentisphaerota bacterium]